MKEQPDQVLPMRAELCEHLLHRMSWCRTEIVSLENAGWQPDFIETQDVLMKGVVRQILTV